MNARRLFLAFLASLFAAMPLCGDDKINHRVQLNVSASDSIKSEVISYISRELRSLGDINIVADDPWFTISVVGLPLGGGNNTTGYALSVIVERPVRYRLVRDFYAKWLEERTLKLMDVTFQNTTHLLTHFVQLGPTGGLEDMCKKIVAEIDGSVFEKARISNQQGREFLEKEQANPRK